MNLLGFLFIGFSLAIYGHAAAATAMCKIDVLVLLQTTSKTQHTLLTQNVVPLVQQLDVSPCGAKVGVVSYSSESIEPLLISFDRYIVKESVINKINSFSSSSQQWSVFDQCQAVEYASDLLRGRTSPALVLVLGPMPAGLQAKLKAINGNAKAFAFSSVKDAMAKVAATQHCAAKAAGSTGSDPIKQNFHQGVLHCVDFIQTLSKVGPTYQAVQSSITVLKTQIGQSVTSFNTATALSKKKTDAVYVQLGKATQTLASYNSQLNTANKNLKTAQVDLNNAQKQLQIRQNSVNNINNQIKSLEGSIASQRHKCRIFKREVVYDDPPRRVKRGWHVGHVIHKGLKHGHEVKKGVDHVGHEISKGLNKICDFVRQTNKKINALKGQLANEQRALKAQVVQRNAKQAKVNSINTQIKNIKASQAKLQASIKSLTATHTQLSQSLAKLTKLSDFVRATSTKVDETKITLKTVTLSIVERLATNIREVLFQFDKDQSLYDSLSVCDLHGLDRKLHLVAVSADKKQSLTDIDDMFGGFGIGDPKSKTRDMSTSVQCVYKNTRGKVLKTLKGPATNVADDHGTYLGSGGKLTAQLAIQKCSQTKNCNYVMRSRAGQVYLYNLKAAANELEWAPKAGTVDSFEIQGTCGQQASFIQYDHGTVKVQKVLATTNCASVGLCLQACKVRNGCNLVKMTGDKTAQLIQGVFTESDGGLAYPLFELVGKTLCTRK